VEERTSKLSRKRVDQRVCVRVCVCVLCAYGGTDKLPVDVPVPVHDVIHEEISMLFTAFLSLSCHTDNNETLPIDATVTTRLPFRKKTEKQPGRVRGVRHLAHAATRMANNHRVRYRSFSPNEPSGQIGRKLP
jgi:hypothetical protein